MTEGYELMAQAIKQGNLPQAFLSQVMQWR